VTNSEYVFVNYVTGEPLTYSAVRSLFKRLRKHVGFHVTPHMLRHTHATELLNDGWDPAWIQKRLGHASVQTTIDTYTHISQATMKKHFQRYQRNRLQVNYGNAQQETS